MRGGTLILVIGLAGLGCDEPPRGDCTPRERVVCVAAGGLAGTAICTADGAHGECTPDPVVDHDAGVGVAEPTAPTLPVMDCPDGWVEREIAFGTICEPWPSTAPLCVAPMMRLPGSAECVPVGDPCPSGALPDTTPPGAIHVVEGAVGGDGTRASPFGTLAEGLAVLAEDGTLVLGRGTYAGLVELPAGSTLRGTCVEQTTLSADLTGMPFSAILVRGAGVTIEDLHVQITGDSVDAGIAQLSATSATIRRVWIEGAGVALLPRRAAIDAERVLITAVEIAFDGSAMPGSIRDTSIVGTRRGGFRLDTDSDLTLSRVYAADIGGVATSYGIRLEQGTLLSADELVLEGCTGPSISATGPEVSLTLTSSVIRDRTDESTAGIQAFDAVEVRLTDTLIDGVRTLALGAGHPDALIEAEDLVILSTHDEPGRFSNAIEILAGAHLSLTRALLHANAGLGVLVTDRGTTATLTDVTVSDVQARRDGLWGRGIHVQLDAMAALERVEIIRAREAALSVTHGASTTARDVALRGTMVRACAADACADDPAGLGVVVTEGGALEIQRFTIDDSPLCGLMVASESNLDVSLGHVRRAAVGACIQVTGFDLARLQSDVRYVDNGIALDTTMLPVPESMASRVGM